MFGTLDLCSLFGSCLCEEGKEVSTEPITVAHRHGTTDAGGPAGRNVTDLVLFSPPNDGPRGGDTSSPHGLRASAS